MSTRKKTVKAIAQQAAVQLEGKTSGYGLLLADLKQEIGRARVRAALAVNHELVTLYWSIGKHILTAQAAQGWGAKVIEQISADLQTEFPDMTGLSVRNILYMKQFAAAYPDEQITQQLAAQIPWFHNCTILDKVSDPAEREFYIRETIANGWSRNVLVHQIESKLYERQGKAVSNFQQTLPPPQSDLAQQLFKDPYTFDFLNLGAEFSERELEKELIHRVRDFLLEMGRGFAFVGSQYHLEVGGEDYYLDLLFYHLELRCFVVIDLKVGKFLPEYAGKMNFYLSAVDDLLKHEADAQSIGLILCKDKNRIIAEYAMRDINKPLAVAEYRLKSELPERLRDKLPDPQELERRLST
ncbi:DUF1016 family protein [bacterium]|nr:DUF1016 family protein [bacterium]